MKISCSWLNEFVPSGKTPRELAELLTFMGVETNVTEEAEAAWDNVVTAKVLSVERHPQADKLSLCQVNDGTDTYPVVCGAQNVAAGQTVPLARIGAHLPGGVRIKKAKIRGVESRGMICSEQELGITGESSGIMVLPETTPLGRPLEEIFGERDSILTVEITGNRPDCLSHWGIAREVSARIRVPVNKPSVDPVHLTGGNVDIQVNDPDLCPRYIGILINNVSVKPSPDWLARRLVKCGLRPINNIVDITNYVLMELGHPLHAFDRSALAGGQLVIRRAAAGEKITALDGKSYGLTPEMLVIADRDVPQAIAGVMGGESSGVTERTTSIILESAVFAPSVIRKTSRALALSSDASYRFERGTGWDVAEYASWRAANLIQELAGGVIEGRGDLISKPYAPVTVAVRPARAKRVLDIEFSTADTVDILESLGMKTAVRGDGAVEASIPSWRVDISQEADLLEELARVKGYEHVPVNVLPILPDMNKGISEPSQEERIRTRLAGLGFCEAMNYSFSEQKELSRFGLPADCRIANPLSKENEVLRPDILPGLWKNLIVNIGQGFDRVALFETGNIFSSKGERRSLGILAYGQVWAPWWGWKDDSLPPAYDFYFMNGLIGSLFPEGTVTVNKDGSPAPWYHPGKCAAVFVNGKRCGSVGTLKPQLTSGLVHEVCYAELDLEAVGTAATARAPLYVPLRRFPPVKRDLSLLAPETVSFERIEAVFRGFTGTASLLQEFRLFSVYRDEKIGKDRISYSLHLTFRHPDHTLTDADVNPLVDKIVERLSSELGVTLR